MSESKAKKIEIKDVDGQTLSKLIDYIYTAEIEVTEENVQTHCVAGAEALGGSNTWAPGWCPPSVRGPASLQFQDPRGWKLLEWSQLSHSQSQESS
ncbi:hypothetical protein P7K49_003786 [Saguinus oedipus]|uniref:BTB domain-containing protein n=1 Tax=Saguinus oedipus TaxID=9490 RepID=A0ABQ9W5I1_SAGOE|nr:hypothetical protein P7K49_003786 [Saguinus oedipus]